MSGMATAATTDQALAPESTAVTERDLRRAISVMRRIAANPFVPIRPTRHQVAYLLAEEREALFTGSGGNGKSTALLASALLDMDRPGWSQVVNEQSGPGPTHVVNGVPVGYAHTQAGAVAAATNYLVTFNGPLVTQPDKYRAAVDEMALPDVRNTLTSLRCAGTDGCPPARPTGIQSSITE